MKRSTWLYAGFTIAACTALLAWAFAPRAVEVEAATVTTGRFETTIDEDGKTRLRDRYVVSAPLAGLLTRSPLREGDEVEANAVVATLTPTLSPMLDERTLREQQARVLVTEAQANSATARVEAAKVGVQQASNEAARSTQLATQGFVSATKLEADRLAVQAAQKELDTAAQERHAASHAVEQARAALIAVRRPERVGARGFEIRSPAAGRVLRVVQPNETVVALGTPLLELGDTRALEVVAELLTADALRASPGSPVQIERWGGSGLLQGRVRRVEPGAFTKVSALGVEEQRVKVLVDITSPADEWRALGDGFRVGVRIVTMALDGAVKVPVAAVFPVPDREGAAPGAMAVFVIEGGRARQTAVQVGARNGSEAWVQQGLAPGAKVIVYPPPAVKDGVRVRARTV
jgi:HlyD family secretion protein